MALYKVYETDVLEYTLQPPGGGWPGLVYNEAILEGDYLESVFLTPGNIHAVWGNRKDINETVVSHTTVYALYQLATVYGPSFGICLAAFDGQTGQRLWTDWEIYFGNAVGMATRSNFWQDTDDASWSHSAYGYSMRHPVRTSEANQKGGRIGMPHFMEWDIQIYDSEWLQANGDPYPVGDQWTTEVLAVLPKENRAIMTRGSNRRSVSIHDYTTRREIFAIPVTANIKRAIAVDNEILYGVASNGVVNVLNYKTGQHGGILALGDVFSTSRWMGVGYDPVYRRMLVFRALPDAPGTGACQSFIEGYRMREVPAHLVKPIPLKAPRENRIVPVYTRIVGEAAKGISGLAVQSEIVGTNGLDPQSVTSDATGKALFYWDTSVAGTDIDQINLSVDYDTEVPGLDPPPANVTQGVPPSNVSNEALFTPGWWLNQPLSALTPAAKWDSYLTGYLDSNDMPFVGVMQTYKWTDFETTTPATYDFSKIDADLAYLSNLGMKLIINIQLTSESNSDIWIPDDILNDITEPPSQIYPQSLDTISFSVGRGIFNLANTNSSGQGFCPILWDENVHARVRALMSALNVEYASDNDVVGYAVGDSRQSATDISNTALPQTETYLEARLRLLTYIDGLTSKLIWEFGDRYSWGHLSNAAQAGINIAPAKLYQDALTPFDPRYALQLSDSDAVSYGYVVDPDAYTRSENQLCTAGNPQTNPYEMMFGGSQVLQCSMKYMDLYRPYFVFWYPEATKWSGTDNILEVCQNYLPSRAKAYWGI